MKEIEKIEVENSQLTLSYIDGRTTVSRKEPDISFTEVLQSAAISPDSVEVVVKELPLSEAWLDIIATFLPLVVFAFLFMHGSNLVIAFLSRGSGKSD